MNRLAVREKCISSYYSWKSRLNTGIEKILNFCFENEKYKLCMAALVLVIMDVAMLFLNQCTPLVSDDLHYAFISNVYTNVNGMDTITTGPRVASLGDIFESQYMLYFTWGARVVGLSLAQIFLMYDKQIFDLANAGVYILLLLVISLHITGKFGRRPGLLIAINSALLAFTPAFGQDFFWVTGACVYLWGGLLSFAYLLAFRFQLEQEIPVINRLFPSILYGLLGIICACTIENIAATMVVLSLLFNVYTYIRKGTCYRWSVFSMMGIIIGTVMMIGAPGNFVRLEYEQMHAGVDINYLKNLVVVTKCFFDPDFLLFPLSGAVVCYIMRRENRNDPVLWFYVIGLLISMYSMTVAPSYGDRAKLGSLILGLIICGRLLITIKMNSLKLKKLWAIMVIAAVAVSGSEYVKAGLSITDYNDLHQTRMEIISRGKAEGNLDLILPEEIPLTRFNATSVHYKMQTDPGWAWNQAFARYYGLHTVRLESNDIRIHRPTHDIEEKQ